MNGKKLKDSILQFAMQGKIVPQNPNDEPASELLQRIKAEKERLIKEGYIKKEKPVAPILEEEILYDIPSSWEWVRLKDLGYITSGGTPKTTEQSYWTNGDIVWVTPSDMGKNKDKFLSDSARKITMEGLNNSSAQLIPKNSIVYSSRAPIGHINIMTCDFSTNQGCKSVTPLLTDLTFLYYALIYMTSEIQKKATGTTFKEVSGTVFGETLIPLPPLNEQFQIVKKIEQLLCKVEEYESANFKVNKLQKEFPMNLEKSILQFAMQGKLVAQNPNDGFAQQLIEVIQSEKEQLIKEKVIKKEKKLNPILDEEIAWDIPSTWEWVRLGDICEINPKNSTEDELDVGFIPMKLIEDGAVNKHTFEERKWKEIKKGYTHFKENDIVVAKITPCFENRKSAIIKALPNGIGAGTTELYVIRPYSGYVDREYLLWIFKSQNFIEGGKNSFSGTAGQQRVSKSYIENYLIPLPPYKEQIRIVKKILEFKSALVKLTK